MYAGGSGVRDGSCRPLSALRRDVVFSLSVVVIIVVGVCTVGVERPRLLAVFE